MPFRSLIDGVWSVGSEIGVGASGRVFNAEDGDGTRAIVKVERRQTEGFEREVEVYDEVEEESGFPTIYFCGRHEGKNVIVMQRLKHSLYDISSMYPSAFTTNDVLKIGIQLLRRLEALHSYGFVHRDLHPGNVMLSHSHGKTLYLIDFASAKKYLSFLGLHVFKYRTILRPISYLFGSVNALEGYTASRRDDLEALIYTLIYLRTGTLPWSNLSGRSRLDEILDLKSQIRSRELCAGLPNCFVSLCRQIRDLSFSERPQYSMFRRELRATLRNRGSTETERFSWQQ